MSRIRPVNWLREHPFAADSALAAVVAVIAVTFHLTLHMAGSHDPSVWGVLLSLGGTLPLAWRRRSPTFVLVTITLFQMAMEAFNLIGPDWVGVLIAAYTLGAYRSGRLLWRLGALAVAVVFTFVVIGVIHGDAPWQSLLSAPVVFVGAIVLGDNVRRRRERVVELAERAERAERERHLMAQQHVLDERARIARELHDIVAHSVSLMVIQAAAARRQLATDPDRVDAALATVEETGRTAMQEMRRMLGVLRDDSTQPELAPQPGLGALDVLMSSVSDLPVEVEV
ncbi:MAG: histidine kinase dimerization/phosphoacceptor domain-containing protein, partial [Actinomycetota bacterium]